MAPLPGALQVLLQAFGCTIPTAFWSALLRIVVGLDGFFKFFFFILFSGGKA